jgi:hypothetical protein
MPGHHQISPKNSLLLVPPTQEQLVQRRFSEVNAAIERHNSRRAAKRSQSVMYRGGRKKPAKGSGGKTSEMEDMEMNINMNRRRSVKM